MTGSLGLGGGGGGIEVHVVFEVSFSFSLLLAFTSSLYLVTAMVDPALHARTEHAARTFWSLYTRLPWRPYDTLRIAHPGR